MYLILVINPVNFLYKRASVKSDGTVDVNHDSEGSGFLEEAKSVFNFGKKGALALSGGILMFFFGVLKDIIPGTEAISEKFGTVGMWLGAGLLGWGVTWMYLDTRKVKQKILKHEPEPIQLELSEGLAINIRNNLQDVNSHETKDLIFDISESLVNLRHNPKKTVKETEAVLRLLDSWSRLEIISKMDLKQDAEFINAGGPKGEDENAMSLKDLKDYRAILLAWLIANAKRNNNGEIVDGDNPRLDPFLSKIEPEELEEGKAKHQHAYSNDFTAVYLAASRYKELFLKKDSFTPASFEAIVRGKSEKDKRAIFKQLYNYMNVLKGAISFVVKSEKEFAGSDLSNLSNDEMLTYRRYIVLKSALTAGLSLRAPVSTVTTIPGSTKLSITDQLNRILKGDAANVRNSLGSNTGLEAKVKEVLKFQKDKYSKKAEFHQPSEYLGIGNLLEYTGVPQLLEYKDESVPLAMAP